MRMIKLAAHQPNFIPWAGFFYKMSLADVFVLTAGVDYTRKSYINRNRIKTPDGPVWLTLPVIRAPLGTTIDKIRIAEPDISFRKIADVIRHNYSKAKFFDSCFQGFIHTLKGNGDLLADVNIALIKYFATELGIKTEIERMDDAADITGESTDRIIYLCKSYNAELYISGFGGEKYQLKQKMKTSGISCQVYDFDHPVYNQLWGPFVPGMSVLDLLFNCGPGSGDILLSRDKKI